MQDRYTCSNGHIFGSPYRRNLSQDEVDKWCAFCHPDVVDSEELLPFLELPRYHYFRAASITKETYDKLLLLQTKKMLILDGKDRWMKIKLIFRESGIVLIGKVKHHTETHVLQLRPWVMEIIDRKQTVPHRETLSVKITNEEFDKPPIIHPKPKEDEWLN